MKSKMKPIFAALPILNGLYRFNRAGRDRWVRTQAERVPPGSLVLDIGAGTAPYRDSFRHCTYKTQDFGQLRKDQLEDSNGYAKIDYVCDILEIPLSSGSVDVVLCTEVLEHVPEPIKVVNELSRLLKRGGVLLLTCPLGSSIHQEPFHFYGGYTPYWYKKFLGAAGFVEIDVIANGGQFRSLSQEILRAFLILCGELRCAARPTRLPMAFAAALLLAAPALILPIIAPILDAFDPEGRYTVGYFIRAKRGDGV